MKRSRITGGLALAFALLLSSAAFAGNNAASLNLSTATQLNGKQLAAGTYKLKWEGSGPAVEVQVLQGKKLIATVPAKVEQTSTRPPRDATVVETAGGSRNLVEARFAGKGYKLVFAGNEAQAQNTQSGEGASQSNQ